MIWNGLDWIVRWLKRHGIVLLATAGVFFIVHEAGGCWLWAMVSNVIGLALADRVYRSGDALVSDALKLVAGASPKFGAFLHAGALVICMSADLLRIVSPLGALVPMLWGR